MTTNPASKVAKDDAARQSAADKMDAARQPAADRITVALVRKASEDLQLIQDRTKLSKTDIVNRAISLYEFFEAEMRAGKDVIVRDRDTGEAQLVRFI